jgi:hypothetical protein
MPKNPPTRITSPNPRTGECLGACDTWPEAATLAEGVPGADALLIRDTDKQYWYFAALPGGTKRAGPILQQEVIRRYDNIARSFRFYLVLTWPGTLGGLNTSLSIDNYSTRWLANGLAAARILTALDSGLIEKWLKKSMAEK